MYSLRSLLNLPLGGWCLACALTLTAATHAAQSNTEGGDDAKHPLASLPLRNIGPAFPSGRIADFAFHSTHHFLVATASGGLWETTNDGTTWQPLFDGEASYSLGVVEIDPSDSNVIWVGSGENNAQRSVAYGDGVYKSTDGGKSWSNMGLKESGHLSKLWINPNDGEHVRIAAQGPLWNCLLYTSPSPRDKRQSRMPSSA